MGAGTSPGRAWGAPPPIFPWRSFRNPQRFRNSAEWAGGGGSHSSVVKQMALSSTPNGLDFCPIRDGSNKFLPPPKKKEEIKTENLLLPSAAGSWLDLCYITVISCVRTAQRVSGKAKDASLDCGPLEFRHGQRSEEGCVGVRNVSDSSLRPCPVPQPGNSARRHCKRGFETKTERQACFLGPLDPQTL